MVLIPKGPDKWEFQAELGSDPLTRKRTRRSKTFHGGKRAAEKAHRAFMVEMAEKRPTAVATVGRLLDAWLEAKTDLSPTTRQEYERLIESRIRPALGSVQLRKLTAADLDRFYRALAEGAK